MDQDRALATGEPEDSLRRGVSKLSTRTSGHLVVPKRSSSSFRGVKCCRVSGPVVAVVICALSFVPWVQLTFYPWEGKDMLFFQPMACVTSTLVSMGTAHLLFGTADAARLHSIVRFAILNWIGSYTLAAWPENLPDVIDDSITLFIGAIGTAAWVLFMRVVMLRLQAMQTATAGAISGRGAHRMTRIIFAALGLQVSLYAAWTMFVSAGLQAPTWILPLFGVSSWSNLVPMCAWTVYATKSFNTASLVMTAVAEQGSGRQADEARLAGQELRHQIVGLVIGSVSSMLRWGAEFAKAGVLWPVPEMAAGSKWISRVVTLFVFVANCLCALWYAGAFNGAMKRVQRRQGRDTIRVKKYLGFSDTWSPDEDVEWHDKVCELASRGFTLEVLLRFYRGLGVQYMAHWDPDKHSTTDVVRHAIIPESAASRSALAPVLMQDVPTCPGKMVTHNWGNLFRDLVAAICADALGEEEYGRAAYMLDHDLDQLETILHDMGKLTLTYWVCAFSVNQHCTICAGNPHGATDSVTGELYPLCECGLPKVWNTTEPTTSSGRSIGCEVNKFDDMMKLLSASDPWFEQVVAIDAEFDVFSRAWCVAELAAANTTGMRQCLKFASAESLSKNENRMRGLRIQDMQASRPEDKDEILATIPDADAFNAELQRLLFEELLPAWNALDSVEQMERVGRLIRWQTCAGLPLVAKPEEQQEKDEDNFVDKRVSHSSESTAGDASDSSHRSGSSCSIIATDDVEAYGSGPIIWREMVDQEDLKAVACPEMGDHEDLEEGLRGLVTRPDNIPRLLGRSCGPSAAGATRCSPDAGLHRTKLACQGCKTCLQQQQQQQQQQLQQQQQQRALTGTRPSPPRGCK